MKVKIEIDEALEEDEVLIRCRGLTEEIAAIQKAVLEIAGQNKGLCFIREIQSTILFWMIFYFLRRTRRELVYTQGQTHIRASISSMNWKISCLVFL